MVDVFIISVLPAIRVGLRSLIEADPNCRVLGEGGSLAALRGLERDPDVVILDAEPSLAAAEALLALEEHTCGLVLLGPVAADAALPALLDTRPFAYLARDTGSEELLAALHAVASGLVVLDRRIGGHLLAHTVPAEHTPHDGTATPAGDLTSREREVLHLVAQGLPNKLIARRLDISEHTVKFHIAAILSKLGATSRTEAVHLGAKRGLVAL